MSEPNPFRVASFPGRPHSDVACAGTRRYALSYRDLEEMMLERCLSVDHTTIYRWGEPLCARA